MAKGIVPTLATVYPRVCGGTSLAQRRSPMPTGLSPRVRGNPIILLRSLSASGVYPRVCGGTLDWCQQCDTDSGLSPRVRGNQLLGLDA